MTLSPPRKSKTKRSVQRRKKHPKTPFPLFNLPFLAVKKVFHLMDNQELFFMSLQSNRAKDIVRLTTPKNKRELYLDVSHDLKIHVGNFRIDVSYLQLDSYPKKCKIFKIGTNLFRLIPRDKPNYWINPVDFEESREDFKKTLIKHVIDTFNSPIISLTCGKGIRSGFGLELLKYFNELALKIRSVKVLTDLSAEDYSEFLNLCSEIQVLSIHSKPPEGFQYSPARAFNNKMVCLAESCSWVKLEDFLQCERLRVSGNVDSRMTPEYLNAFFKKLITGDHKLKQLGVAFGPPESFRLVVYGLGPRVEIEDDEEEEENVFKTILKDGRTLKIFLEKSNLKMDLI